MSYSIIAAILVATIALSSSSSVPVPSPVFSNEHNVLVRFYSDFAQLYRPATQKSFVDQEQTMERYQFFFTEREYLHIVEESLTLLYTDVIERTVTFCPTPNFAVNGSRYFYRRDPKSNYSIEIELVNPSDRLFREVSQPNRYFYLPSIDDLQFVNQVPVMPYYEVTFICNSSYPQRQSPLLSYIDRSLQYTPRYLLDVPTFGNGKPVEMIAYADVRNIGEQTLIIKGAELIAGDVTLNRQALEYLRTSLSFGPTAGSPFGFTRSLNEQATGTYVYQLSLPSSVTLPARSLKSLQFLETNVTVVPFLYYSSVFSPVNCTGKLFNAYNLTSVNNFLPSGRVFLREQGRFLGQLDLPELSAGVSYTMVLGSDADVSYRRRVTALQGDQFSDSMTYYVEYIFENNKSARDVQVFFFESFNSFRYFQVQNLTTPMNNQNLPNIVLYGTDLRGYVFIPRQGSQTMISYNFIVYKNKPPTVNF